MLSTQQVNAYLARIKTPRLPECNLNFLNKLHRNHLYNIPFENLDIWMKNEIILDKEKLFDKIIIRRRGGFCYELNGMFFELLSSLGFKAKLVSAKAYNDQGDLGPAFDHAAIVVDIKDREYLCDVGFGDSFLNPKELNPFQAQIDFNRYFKLDKDLDDNFTLLQSDDSVIWEKKYEFDLEERAFVEFIDMCHYHSTNEKSHFKKKKLITQATNEGRITLTNSSLKTSKRGVKEEEAIINHDDFCVKLHQHFGILYRVTR